MLDRPKTNGRIKMSNIQDTFGVLAAQTIGTTWNNELVVLQPEDETKKSCVVKCKYLQDNKMLIEKKSGEIAIISIDKYSSIRLLYPKNCLEVDKSEVV
jgi:hypothetical protein